MKITRIVRQMAVLFAAVAVISCGIETTAPAVPETPAVQQDLVGGLVGTLGRVVGGLLTCRPLAYQSNSALIGPAGGTLQLGPHSLTIPRGALDRTVRITGQVVSDTVNSVRFSPEGLEFDRPATLTLSYQNCNLVAGLLANKRIAYTTEGLRIITYVPSRDDLLGRKIHGRLDHFSRYAAAY